MAALDILLSLYLIIMMYSTIQSCVDKILQGLLILHSIFIVEESKNSLLQ